MDRPRKTLKDWATAAINVQDACNLSGVVHSFSQFMTWSFEEWPDLGTDARNTHYIAVLFSSKIASLTGSEVGLNFSKAYQECANVAEGKAA